MGHCRPIAFATAASIVTTLVMAGIAVLATPRDAPAPAALASASAPSRTMGSAALADEPVVRLPTITVVASRNAELAKMAREEALAHANDAAPPVARAAPAVFPVYAANRGWQ
jgi:hypothetical protein